MKITNVTKPDEVKVPSTVTYPCLLSSPSGHGGAAIAFGPHSWIALNVGPIRLPDPKETRTWLDAGWAYANQPATLFFSN